MLIINTPGYTYINIIDQVKKKCMTGRKKANQIYRKDPDECGDIFSLPRLDNSGSCFRFSYSIFPTLITSATVDPLQSLKCYHTAIVTPDSTISPLTKRSRRNNPGPTTDNLL